MGCASSNPLAQSGKNLIESAKDSATEITDKGEHILEGIYTAPPFRQYLFTFFQSLIDFSLIFSIEISLIFKNQKSPLFSVSSKNKFLKHM